MASSTATSGTAIVANNNTKKRILSAREYNELCNFIESHEGLAIDCEMDLLDKFPQYDRLTLKSVLQAELSQRMRSQHWRYEANAKKYLAMFYERLENSPRNNDILLNIAREERIGPVTLCRSILKQIYNFQSKTQLSRLLRYPYLIEDTQLSSNVAQCLISDNQDGPLIDLKRRALGEEYEFKLKQMANNAGMHYYDETALRRLGYDKTPDIKMIIPFLYKGVVINWIESKAYFGDIKAHKYNIEQQLNSYCNRLGSGIIIYWFGYHEDILSLADNVKVLDDFPNKADIELLDISEAMDLPVEEDIETTT